MKTGLIATKLGLVAFIVPYMFVYGPSLLFQGSAFLISARAVTAVLGVLLVTSAMHG